MAPASSGVHERVRPRHIRARIPALIATGTGRLYTPESSVIRSVTLQLPADAASVCTYLRALRTIGTFHVEHSDQPRCNDSSVERFGSEER